MEDTKNVIKNNNKKEKVNNQDSKENVKVILFETVKSAYENTFSARSSLQARASTGLVALIALLTIFFTSLKYDIFKLQNATPLAIVLATVYALTILAIFIISILAIISFIKRNKSKPMHSIFPVDIIDSFIKGNNSDEVYNDLITSYLEQQKENSQSLEKESKKLDKAFIFFSIVSILMICSCIIRFIMEAL